MAFDNTTFPYTPPVVGVTLGPLYGTKVNQILNALIAAIQPKLTPAQLNFNQQVTFQNQNLVSIGALNLYDRTTIDTSAVNSIQAVNGELYFIDGAGNNIQITSGGALNAAALGGITGDYGGGFPNSIVAANQAGNFYSFSTAVGTYSYLKCLGLIMTNASGNTAQLGAPSSLVNHTATWLASLPAAGNEILMISNLGVMSHGGVSSVSGFTVTASEDLIFSGTGKIRHGTYEFPQNLAHNTIAGGAPVAALAGLGLTAAGTIKLSGANGLKVGSRIIGFKVSTSRTNAGTMNMDMYRVTTAGVATLVQSFTRVTVGGWAQQTNTLGTPLVVATGEHYFILIADSAGASVFGGWALQVDQN